MGFYGGGLKMKAMKLDVERWLAEEVREAAKACKLTVPAYIRRAVVRQLLQDLQLQRLQSLERQAVEAKAEA